MDASEEHESATRGWSASLEVRPRVVPPCSKSHAIRALLAAGLARGTTHLRGLSEAEDVLAALRVLEGCGVRVERGAPGWVAIEGLAPSGWRAERALDVGESGTVARLVTALMALVPDPGTTTELVARGSLLERSSAPLLAALGEAGATLAPSQASASWPLSVVSAEPPSALCLNDPSSSQELSGLLLALAARPEARSIEVTGELPSRPYADMTIEVLRAFGARIDEQAQCFEVAGPLVAPAGELILEPDASAAAVALAAACLTGGSTRVEGFGACSLQGDIAIARHLAAFGCNAAFEDGALRAGGAPTHGADLDLTGEPDLAPVLAAVAGAVALRGSGEGARTRLCGLETLNSKECRRLDVLRDALRELGLEVEADDSTLRVAPGEPTDTELVLDPHGDHRMAFAFALLGLVRPGVRVSDPGCVSKSWPDFWEACVASEDPQN